MNSRSGWEHDVGFVVVFGAICYLLLLAVAVVLRIIFLPFTLWRHWRRSRQRRRAIEAINNLSTPPRQA